MVLAGPVIPVVSTETNTGKSANIWHQEIKKEEEALWKKNRWQQSPPNAAYLVNMHASSWGKTNLVTFCLQKFSFPNRADIEIKTFLEVICIGAEPRVKSFWKQLPEWPVAAGPSPSTAFLV